MVYVATPRAIRPDEIWRSAAVQQIAMASPAAATPSGRALRKSKLAATWMTIQSATHTRLIQITARARWIASTSAGAGAWSAPFRAIVPTANQAIRGPPASAQAEDAHAAGCGAAPPPHLCACWDSLWMICSDIG